MTGTKLPGADHFYRKNGSWGTIFPMKILVRGTKILRTKIPVTDQMSPDVPPPGGELDRQTLTLQQTMDTQLVLLRAIAAFMSQRICTNSKTMCSLHCCTRLSVSWGNVLASA